jgi:hypothetical protein
MGVLGTTFAGAFLAMGGGDKKKTEQGPPVNASSKDEEKFIQYVLLLYDNVLRLERPILAPSSPNWAEADFFFYRDFLKSVEGGDNKAKH